MPTFKQYDFDCPECGTRFEATIEDSEPYPDCPKCGGKEVQRVFGFGGYAIHGNNSASVRPIGSGCFKGRKH